MMKRAQTEVLGLLVIVVLFIVILMFYLAFSMKSQQRTGIKESEQAKYISDAILKYTPECRNEVAKSIRDIILGCDFEANNKICNKPCKDLLKEESKKILDLADSKYRYDFKIRKTKNNKDSVIDIARC